MQNVQKPPVRIQSLDSIAAGLKDIVDSPNEKKYLTGSTIGTGKGFKLATAGDKALYLSARAKTNPLRSAWDKLNGHRTSQHDGAILALELLVDKVNEDDRLNKRPWVSTSIQAINDLVAETRLSKKGIRLKDIKPHLDTVFHANLAMPLERKQDIATRQARIDDLHARASQPLNANPEETVEAYIVSNGLHYEGGKTGTLFADLEFSLQQHLTAPGNGQGSSLGERVIEVGDQGEHRLMRAMQNGADLSRAIEEKRVGRDAIDLNERTGVFVEQMAKDGFALGADASANIFSMADGFARKTSAFSSALVRHIQANDLAGFQAQSQTMSSQMRVQLNDMQSAARLLTDESYLALVPDALRDSVRSYGEALQEIAVGMLDPRGAFMTTYRLAQAASTSPEELLRQLNSAIKPPPDDLPPPLPRPAELVGPQPAPSAPNVARGRRAGQPPKPLPKRPNARGGDSSPVRSPPRPLPAAVAPNGMGLSPGAPPTYLPPPPAQPAPMSKQFVAVAHAQIDHFRTQILQQPSASDPEAVISEFRGANELYGVGDHAEHFFGDIALSLRYAMNPLDESVRDKAGKISADPDKRALMQHIETSASLSRALGNADREDLASFIGITPQARNMLSLIGRSINALPVAFDDLLQASRYGDLELFKAGVEKMQATMRAQMDELQSAAQLFTDDKYLARLPEKMRDTVRRLGESYLSIGLDLFNPHGAFAATYRLLQAAKASPSEVMKQLASLKAVPRPQAAASGSSGL